MTILAIPGSPVSPIGPVLALLTIETRLRPDPVPQRHGHPMGMVMMREKIVPIRNTPTLAGQTGAAVLTDPAAHIRRDDTVSPALVIGVARVVEWLIIVLVGINIYGWYVAGPEAALAANYWTVSMVTATVSVVLFSNADLYSIQSLRSYLKPVGRLIAVWTGVFALLTVAAFLTKIGAEFSRVWLVLWFVAGGTFMVAARMATSATLRAWTREGRLARSVAIIGSGPQTDALIAELRGSEGNDVAICGVFDDRGDARTTSNSLVYSKIGSIKDLVEFARTVPLDMLIVALPLTAEARVLEIVKTLKVLPADIRLSAHRSRLRFRPRAYSYIGTVPFLDLLDKPMTDWGGVWKTLEDRVLAALMLVLLSPVMAAVALAIKLDSRGPVLFRQKRYGFNNELIEVLKFRSMYTEKSDANAVKLVTKDDPRVTRVGRFIRRTSLDELPQIVNVLKGQLSLVGPRPHAVQAKAHDRLYNDVVEDYFARHRVKPGITGWAQINGWRGETETEEQIMRRVEHDLHYIENWSILFDLYILVMTPLALLNTDKAY